MWTPDNVRKNIALYHGFSVFSSLDFTRAVFVSFLYLNHMSNTQTGILQAIFFWAALIFEIPSGFFADVTKRKYSSVMGLGLWCVAFLLYLGEPSFVLYMAVFFLMGAGSAFLSGAHEALLFDGLKQAGTSWLLRHIEYMSRARSYALVALALASLVGGLIFEVHPPLVFVLSALSIAVALVLVVWIPESSSHERGRGRSKITRGQLYPFIKESRLLFFMVTLSLLEGMHTTFFIFFQKFLIEKGVSYSGVGFCVAAAFLTSALATYLSSYFKKIKVISLVGVVSCILSFLVLVFRFELPLWLACSIFLLIHLLGHMLFVHTDQYIQEACPSEIRASVISLQSFCNGVMYGLSFLIIGVIADQGSMSQGLWWLFVWPLMSAFVVLIWFQRKKITDSE